MNKHSKEVNEQIEYGLDKIEESRFVKISLKDFMFIYKAVEEFRRFFHNRMHYPLLSDIHTYLGDRDKGAYSILSKLYSKVLDKYLPEDIDNPPEEDENKFTHPEYPYYYNLKTDDKYQLVASGNVEAPIFHLIKEMGFEVYKDGNIWIAEDYNAEFKAESPSQLLSLISLYKVKGRNWKVDDEKIENFIQMDLQQ